MIVTVRAGGPEAPLIVTVWAGGPEAVIVTVLAFAGNAGAAAGN